MTQDIMIKRYKEIVFDGLYAFNDKTYKIEKARMSKQYRRFYPENKAASILDYGCGSGFLLNALYDAGYTTLTGIDRAEDQIKSCQKRFPAIKFISGTLSELRGSSNEKYDIVFMIHVIEHLTLEKAIELLEEIRLIIKPEGKLIMTTPNACFAQASYHLYHDLTHKRLYDTESLVQLFKLAGFGDINYYPEEPVAFDFKSFVRSLLWRIRSLWLKIVFTIDVGPGRDGIRKIIVAPAIIAEARTK
jgi:SAM-dependent methyltransferase